MVSVPDCLERISAVLQLMGQLEHSGPPPASKTIITRLPRTSITQEDIDLGQDCSVCMESFRLNEDAKRLECNHFFHSLCIDPWLDLHNTCPVCRKAVEDSSFCGPQSSSRSYNNHLADAAQPPSDQQRNSSSREHYYSPPVHH